MRVRILGLAAIMVLTSGCLNTFDDPVEPHRLRIVGVDVSAPVVSSGSVFLLLETSIDNTGSESPILRLETKAYDQATSLLVDQNETVVGSIRPDETRPVPLGLTVPRTSSYRLEVLVYEEDRVTQRASVNVGNVAALARNLFDAGIKISEMDFLARNVTASRVLIEAKVYVTNEAGNESKALQMQVKAREVTTGLLADEQRVDLEPVSSEETRAASVELSVPGGHNYEVEAVVWDGDYIVERGTGHVQLLPTFTKPKGQDLVVSSPNVEDFVRPTGAASGGFGTGGTAGTGSYGGGSAAKQPGPGLVLVAAAVVGLAILLKGRKQG